MDADLHLRAITAERNAEARRLVLARRAHNDAVVGPPARSSLRRRLFAAIRAAFSASQPAHADTTPPAPAR